MIHPIFVTIALTEVESVQIASTAGRILVDDGPPEGVVAQFEIYLRKDQKFVCVKGEELTTGSELVSHVVTKAPHRVIKFFGSWPATDRVMKQSAEVMRRARRRKTDELFFERVKAAVEEQEYYKISQDSYLIECMGVDGLEAKMAEVKAEFAADLGALHRKDKKVRQK